VTSSTRSMLDADSEDGTRFFVAVVLPPWDTLIEAATALGKPTRGSPPSACVMRHGMAHQPTDTASGTDDYRHFSAFYATTPNLLNI
jgi:hypothetical protein